MSARCSNTCSYSNTYYISNDGNDVNPGTSESTPWKTINRINKQNFKPGDKILFKAGDVWRETLYITNSGEENNWIIYSRYGKGRNPRLLASNKANNWTETSFSNVWVSTSVKDFSSYAKAPHYLSYPGRIFLMTNDSVTWGNYHGYEEGLSGLKKEFDYTSNSKTNEHFLYSPTDPNTRYDSIEVTQRKWCIRMEDSKPENYIEINSIDMKFAREDGFFSGYPAVGDPHHLIFRNCSIQYIGTRGSGHAYGLGVWHSELLIEKCYFSDCGRRAISYNLYDVNTQPRKRSNVIVRNNIFKRGYHTTSLDISSVDPDGDTITDIYFYNNIIDDSELDDVSDHIWGQIPSRVSQGLYFNHYPKSFMDNVYVYNNIFIGSTSRAINIFIDGTIHIWNNTITGYNTSMTAKNYDGQISAGGDWGSPPALLHYTKIDLRNNILHDNIPDNGFGMAATHTNEAPIRYIERDYNLYSTVNLFPSRSERYISSYWRIPPTENFHAYSYREFAIFRRDSAVELNSPKPQYAKFINESERDYQLSLESPARNAGIQVRATLTDPFGINDTLGIYDFFGRIRSHENPSIGAIE